MPKVLIIINRLNIGGMVSHVANLLRYLKDDFEIRLLAGQIDPSEGNAEYLLEDSGIKPTYIPSMQRAISPSKDWKAYHFIKDYIKEYQPDIVHTHAAKAGGLGRLAAHSAKVPVIIHTFHGHVFHSYFSPLKTNFFIQAERYFASKSSAIITISELQKKDIGTTYKICDPSKIAMIPLGYNLESFDQNTDEKRKFFRQEWGLQENEIAIGIVGRLVPIKNHDLFLRVIGNLTKQKTKKFKAFIIGDGELRADLESKAKALGINFNNKADDNAQLIFTSWLKNVDEVYAGLDIVCLTSLNEGTPVSLIEALAASCPVISTDVGGVKDVLGTDFPLVESDDSDDFTRKTMDLMAKYDYKIRSQTSKKDQTIDKFGLKNMISLHKKLYLSLLDNQKSK